MYLSFFSIHFLITDCDIDMHFSNPSSQANSNCSIPVSLLKSKIFLKLVNLKKIKKLFYK